jgi:HEAT repeat protein
MKQRSGWWLVVVVAGIGLTIGSMVVRMQLETRHREQVIDRITKLRERASRDAGDQQAVDELIRAVRSSDPFERSVAARQLGMAGANAAAAVDVLAEALGGEDLNVARAAAASIGEIGPAAQRAVPDLIAAVRTQGERDIGWFAAESLGKVGDPRDETVRHALTEALSHPNDRMQARARLGLRSLDARVGAAASRPATTGAAVSSDASLPEGG